MGRDGPAVDRDGPAVDRDGRSVGRLGGSEEVSGADVLGGHAAQAVTKR